MIKVIVGLGITGLSCVRHLVSRGEKVAVVDSRECPPELVTLQQEFPQVPFFVGGFDSTLLKQASELIVSPGVSLQEPAIAARIAAGVPVQGDIELFAQVVKKPVVAITGSNGKTTVTTLVGQMVQEAGFRASICGNIGQPVLLSLEEPLPDFYIMELSSFQLETTYSLRPQAAVVLNLSPDHMDRYAQYEDYCHAKRQIYLNCSHAVVNADEPEIWQHLRFSHSPLQFCLSPIMEGFCIRRQGSESYLAWGERLLMPVSELVLQQRHDYQNALAALALGNAIGLSIDSMLETLRRFKGLPHRCQWVGDYGGIRWYNDSKGTNVGATIAALMSLGGQKKARLLLIAGGDSKRADLSALLEPIVQYVDQVILMGKDAPLFHDLLRNKVPLSFVNSMKEAVVYAAQWGQPGDLVLLSPACASLDMFRNYAHRGEQFVQSIQEYFLINQ